VLSRLSLRDHGHNLHAPIITQSPGAREFPT
jgi:hypothetical protein